MNRIRLSIFGIALLAIACKKEDAPSPANQNAVNQGLDCATCPSIFHPFETLIEDTTINTGCDYFNTPPWPATGSFGPGEIVGFTQDDTQPVIVGFGGTCQFGVFEGMYLNGLTSFTFDGSDQEARFLVYGDELLFSEIGFSVDDSPIGYLDGSFPFTFGDVTVDIDYSAPPVDFWSSVYLIFSGPLYEVGMIGFESGLINLCVTKTSVIVDVPVIDKTNYIHFDDFYDYAGGITGSYPNRKTPTGYYGQQGATMAINFTEFLGYSPTRIGFVHASSSESNYLVNVQIDDTPLFVTVLDSLDYFLEPYGYRATVYSDPAGLMWMDTINPPVGSAYVDSVIITGNNINKVKLGVDLDASELRHVCSYYE